MMEEEAKKYLRKMWDIPSDLYDNVDMVIFQVPMKKLATWLVEFARSQQRMLTNRQRTIWFLNGVAVGLTIFLMIYAIADWIYGVGV